MKNKVSYLVISDIHLGHDKTKTDYIVNNLLTYFKDNHKVFKTLDVIFIAGDIFDKLLSSSSNEYNLAIGWLTALSQYCIHNQIKLRILEGTPSHDWRQATIIETMLTESKTDLDFKYISTLDIEHMSDLGINILYLPDEYKHNASETFQDVETLLNNKQLTQVDIVIMHGQFNYQLPIQLESSHDESSFLNITKYYISIGHIHISSVNKRILAQGSFDRLSHNEEADKGAMLINIYSTGDMEFFFIKNKHAKQYVTYVYQDDEDIDFIIKSLNRKLKTIPLDSHVRLKAIKNDKLKNILKVLKDKYPLYHFKIEYLKEDENTNDDIITDIVVIDSFNITRDNIEELLYREVSKHELSKEELMLSKEEFTNIIDNL